MTTQPRTILVTGGAGYIGSILVGDLLARGDQVRVLDRLVVGGATSLHGLWGRAGLSFVAGDVRDERARAQALEGVDAVVHLAAIVGDPACARAPELAREVNLEASKALAADAAAAGSARFVLASTCSNYGKMADTSAAATEEWELNPVSLYAETKVAAELDVLARADDSFATTCLRFATVYGTSPRMRFDLTVNEFARDALLRKELLVYGEQFWRPYVHVRDAARAAACVLDAEPDLVRGQVFNVGDSDENYRKQDLVELLQERVPDLQVERVAKTEDPRDYRVSFAKVARTLGFGVERRVPQGIDEVLSFVASGAVADPFADVYRN
jgi:nucleoside-diphosphate-sugar epimerase